MTADTTYVPNPNGTPGTVSTTQETADPWGLPTGYGSLSVITNNNVPPTLTSDNTQATNAGFGQFAPGPLTDDNAQAPEGGPNVYGAATPTTSTIDGMLQAGNSFTADQLKDLQSKLWLAGMYSGTGVTSAAMIPFGHYDEATIQAYGALLTLNAQQAQRGMSNSVDDTTSALIAQRIQTGQANPTGAKTSTSTSYDISDPNTAKAILTNVLQALKGTGVPTPQEISGFQTALNSYEQANPTTDTTTSNSDGTQTDTQKAGTSTLNAAGKSQLAQDWLMQNEGNQVASHQVATTYYQAALSALQAPVQLQGA